MQESAENQQESMADGLSPLSHDELLALLKERAERFSVDGAHSYSDNHDTEEVIVFSQGNTQYAVSLEALGEIRTIAKLTDLPLVNSAILGVTNVRGRIVPLYRLSDNTQSDKAVKGFALVGHGAAAHLAIWAEDIVGTLKIKGSCIKSPPVSLLDRDYIRGVNSEGTVFLDLEKLVNNKKLYLA